MSVSVPLTTFGSFPSGTLAAKAELNAKTTRTTLVFIARLDKTECKWPDSFVLLKTLI